MNKKQKEYKRLKLDELQAIFVMREQGVSFQKIGDALGRSKSTICEAVNGYRHPFSKVWRSMTALEKAKHVYDQKEKNKSRQGNHGRMKDPKVRKFVYEKLKDDYSPEEIVELMKRDMPGHAVCMKTIYNFTKFDGRDLRKYLAEKGKPRSQQVARRRKSRQPAPEKRSIHDRTIEINERLELGHLECDTIVTKKGGGGALLVVVDRVARMTWVRLIPDLQALTVLWVLRAILHDIPSHLRKSITFDNGSEFGASEMYKLEKWFLGFKVYYCDPYSAWQRGSVENTNRKIRRYFPKGTDFSTISKEQVYQVQKRINRRLMKCLGWRCPYEVWDCYLQPGILLPIAA